MGIRLRLRASGAVHNLPTLSDDASLEILQQHIYETTRIPASLQIIKAGFPPKTLLTESTSARLTELGLRSGDVLIVERSELKESHEQVVISGDNLTFRRIEIDSDNSCLFNAIGYVLADGNVKIASELRKVISEHVLANPVDFNEAVLGKSPAEYCQWIQKDTWGGEIELAILSSYYKAEISAVDIQTLHIYTYGENSGYSKRVFVLYDGIHYDAIAALDKTSKTITQFQPSDSFALARVQALAQGFHDKRQFVDVNKFTLKCGDCNLALQGQKEAVEHAQKTSHINFVQY